MNILFVYNKKAGKRFEPSVVNEISEVIPDSEDYTFVDIHDLGNTTIEPFDTLVAIGGDGTVNTVAELAAANHKTLGIIPKGSGDGLARFLGIPRHTFRALEIILYGKKEKIDSAEVSGKFFINVAGAGFEAEIAHRFGSEGIRGLRGYAKTIFESFSKQGEKEVTLTINGKKTRLSFFSLSIANGAQWGNNFEIASKADIQDGLIDIAVMKKPKWYQIMGLLSYLKSKNQSNNSLFTYYKASEIDIKRSGKKWHLDGEPIILKNKKTIKVNSNSLEVHLPK